MNNRHLRAICFGAIVGCGNPVGAIPLPKEPPASAGHSLIYHAGLEKVLLINAGLGGMDDAGRIGKPTQIWSWNGSAWTLIDSSAGPTVRNLGGVVYDSKRQVIVLFGGTASQDLNYGDTWEWSASIGWTKRSDSGPGVRSHTQMAYDPIRGRTVLFGGQDAAMAFVPDTWEWDGSAWTKVATSGPSPRVHHAMAWDAEGQRIILVGGGGTSGDLGDAWAWNGSAWTSIASADDRTHALLAPLDGSGKLALVTGMPNRPMKVLEGTNWQSVAGNGPSARYLSAAAFDAKRGVLVLFGGGDADGNSLFADTWEYRANQWVKVR